MATVLSSVVSGVASAATCTAGAVVNSSAAVASAVGNAVVEGRVLAYAGSAAKGVAEVAGALVVSTAGMLTLKAVGFTAVGPAAGSYAAAWMSSIAAANGGGVAAGSFYSAVQSVAMSGGLVLGTPAVLAAGAVPGALMAWL